MYSTADTAEAVGCPIRKSTDQSLLAAPRGLSQRAASFIASQCQGIHQMPFRRLISTYGCVTRRRKPARIRQRCIIMTQPTARPTAGTTALSGHPRSRILFTCQRSHTHLGGYLFSLPRISRLSVCAPSLATSKSKSSWIASRPSTRLCRRGWRPPRLGSSLLRHDGRRLLL